MSTDRLNFISVILVALMFGLLIFVTQLDLFQAAVYFAALNPINMAVITYLLSNYFLNVISFKR